MLTEPKLDNEHLKREPFIPFLGQVSTAIDRALVELVSQNTGIVSIELLKDERSELEYLGAMY